MDSLFYIWYGEGSTKEERYKIILNINRKKIVTTQICKKYLACYKIDFDIPTIKMMRVKDKHQERCVVSLVGMIKMWIIICH